MLAWECPVSGRHHVVDDTVVVEFLPEIKPLPGGKYRMHRSLVRSIYDNPRDREWLGPS